MTNSIKIVLGLLVLLLLIVAISLYLTMARHTENQTNNQSITNSLPNSQGVSNTAPGVSSEGSQNANTASNDVTVTLSDGGTVQTADFKQASSTVTAPEDPGYYVLAGGLSPNPASTPFSIVYNDANQSFNVTLLQEPLAQVRLEAENYLLQKLNISQSDMCRLTYVVGVPSSVNQYYSGENLGFSFCPGATPL